MAILRTETASRIKEGSIKDNSIDCYSTLSNLKIPYKWAVRELHGGEQ